MVMWWQTKNGPFRWDERRINSTHHAHKNTSQANHAHPFCPFRGPLHCHAQRVKCLVRIPSIDDNR